MDFATGFIVGGVVFSIVASILYVTKERLTAPKSEYEIWKAENLKNNIVRPRSRPGSPVSRSI